MLCVSFLTNRQRQIKLFIAWKSAFTMNFIQPFALIVRNSPELGTNICPLDHPHVKFLFNEFQRPPTPDSSLRMLLLGYSPSHSTDAFGCSHSSSSRGTLLTGPGLPVCDNIS